MANAARYDLS